ncbi:hypothetical protein [Pseudoalteromonas sp. R3]|uniref:hypothetical protein n=1 Tax=Pseudoalteromonas sp. R3 TaxID=1709477 RepID=UPI0006B5C37C|nr:hypothetical protein [Pseudoalteromonas sp. R3]AZZ98835.1 hypothetical protein ELR70_18060 [Pseudoalteromonas sp. R3]
MLTPKEICKIKLLLSVLIIPSVIGWGGLCLLGLMVFGHSALEDVRALLMSTLALIGLGALACGAISIVKFPNVTKVTLTSFFVGLTALTTGGFFGFFTVLYALSFVSLVWAGIILLGQYKKLRS